MAEEVTVENKTKQSNAQMTSQHVYALFKKIILTLLALYNVMVQMLLRNNDNKSETFHLVSQLLIYSNVTV